MPPLQLEVNCQGYLILPPEIAARYFPDNVCVAIWREPELWILPIHNSSAGGLLLKQRNAHGERSVLIWEALPTNWPTGLFPAFWDEDNAALRIALKDGRRAQQNH